MKKFLKLVMLVSVAAITVFILKPSPINPSSYIVPGIREINSITRIDLTNKVKSIAQNQIHSSEGLVVDENNNIYSGNGDKIVKITPDEKIVLFAETGGQNLGMSFDKDGNLIVANNSKGLLKINKQGEIKDLLYDIEDDIEIKYPNGIAVASDGTIYFSNSSSKFNGTKQSYFLDMLEGRPHGALYSFNPKTNQLTTLLSDLRYANGVALSKNEDFLLVNESYGYRVNKYYLKGPKKGKKEIFIDELYGYPDGISTDREGNFYLAIFAPRKPFLDWAHKYPFLKKQIAKLPTSLLPKPAKSSSILVLNEEGKIIKQYYDDSGKIFSLSSVKRYGNDLYIGTLAGRAIWKYSLSN